MENRSLFLKKKQTNKLLQKKQTDFSSLTGRTWILWQFLTIQAYLSKPSLTHDTLIDFSVLRTSILVKLFKTQISSPASKEKMIYSKHQYKIMVTTNFFAKTIHNVPRLTKRPKICYFSIFLQNKFTGAMTSTMRS